jgi:DNA-binding response OmpR family regulator
MGRWPSTVLVVEDARETLDAYAFLLQVDGFRVLKAATGRDAVRLSGHHHIDIVITDLNLPDIPGDVLIRTLRAETGASLRVAAITGEDSPQQARARQAGADVVFTKPVEWRDVLTWLRSSVRATAA